MVAIVGLGSWVGWGLDEVDVEFFLALTLLMRLPIILACVNVLRKGLLLQRVLGLAGAFAMLREVIATLETKLTNVIDSPVLLHNLSGFLVQVKTSTAMQVQT